MKTVVLNLYQSIRPKRLLDSVTIVIMVLVVVLLIVHRHHLFSDDLRYRR